jgi:RND family efflux transporter MFP subunit
VHFRQFGSVAIALALALSTGCDRGSAATTDKAGDAASKGGAPGAGAPGAVRRPMSVVLGPNDVISVRKGIIESSVAVSGNLKPIEQIDVRARVEGNILQVNVREGTRVGRGQLLASFEDATQQGDRASAEADVESAKSDVTNAQWNADQSQELFKAGAIPERDLRTAQQTLVATKARLAAAESRLRAMSQSLEDTRIVAPTSGVVSARSVEAGEHVQRGATLFTVVRSNVLELEASVPARNANDVNVNLPVRFTAGGRDFTGRVARVSPTIDPASRSVTLYVEVPNGDGSLKGNTFATGRVIGRTIPNAVLVPTSAIRQTQTDTRPFVYAIAGDAAQRRNLTLGIVDEVSGMAQVTDGLVEGDRVIGATITGISDGMKVTVVTNDQRPGGAAGTRALDGTTGATRRDSTAKDAAKKDGARSKAEEPAAPAGTAK